VGGSGDPQSGMAPPYSGRPRREALKDTHGEHKAGKHTRGDQVRFVRSHLLSGWIGMFMSVPYVRDAHNREHLVDAARAEVIYTWETGGCCWGEIVIRGRGTANMVHESNTW